MLRDRTVFVLVLLACGLIGCGENYGTPVTVTGKVTVAGKPVEKARIIFRANDKKLPGELATVVSELKPDGTYSVEKVYPAEYTVMLETTEVMDATKGAEPPPNPLSAYGPTSALRAKVAADKKQFDFELPAGPAGK